MSQSRRKQQFKEYLYIIGLTIVLFAITPTIVRLLTHAWQTEGIVYKFVWGVGRAIGNTDAVFIFPVALYIGLVTIFSLDRMKRIQAVILGLASIYGTITLLRQGLLIEHVDWLSNAPVFVAGLLTGGYLGGGKKLLDESWPHEFRRAPKLILGILFIILSVGLLEVHIGYQNPVQFTQNGVFWTGLSPNQISLNATGAFGNIVTSGILLFAVREFTAYDLQRSFMVLGPKRGGKTTLMTGAFHTANEMTNGNASASDKLLDYHQNLISADSGFGRIDEPTAASRTYDLWFNYDYGEYLKKNIRVEAIDHGGEVLLDLKDEIDKLSSRSWSYSFTQLPSRIRASLFGVEDVESEFRSGPHEDVARSIAESDSLVITIPIDDFLEGNVSPDNLPEYHTPGSERDSGPLRPAPAEYLAEYDKILDWYTNEKQADIIIVITMADLVLGEFREQKLNGSQLETEEEYRRFEHWIKSEIIGPELDRLQAYSDEETPLSVHFNMNHDTHAGSDDSKQANPQLPDGGVEFVGGKRLLRKLGE